MIEETLEDFIIRKKGSPERVKAEVVRTNKEYIISKEGEEGFEKVKKRMEELGGEIDFKSLNGKTWEEDWRNSLFIATAREVFNWNDEDIFEMGRYIPRASFFIKSIIQYLASLDMVLKNVGVYWDKHHDFGSLEAVEHNKEGKYVIIRKRNFLMHPVMCSYHAGYFKGISEFVIKGDNLRVEETKCMHKGDEYHEYIIKWD